MKVSELLILERRNVIENAVVVKNFLVHIFLYHLLSLLPLPFHFLLQSDVGVNFVTGQAAGAEWKGALTDP